MNFLLWVIFGGIAGWIASIIVGNNPQMGILANIVVGIIGALLGGWIAHGVGARDAEHPATISGFIWAIIGAIVLLVILNLIF
ncbi:MAG TPA: GlsB/YeaQ/YmgE family stress response membrane protein [Candidatus Paceibacterota bacterium]|nr:GlsB/YeaQ/YmgE family stress response membrane protein [Candidatus Paceibacterota bacterium]